MQIQVRWETDFGVQTLNALDRGCGQRARLLLWRSEFESRWSLQFFSVNLCLKRTKVNIKAWVGGPFLICLVFNKVLLELSMWTCSHRSPMFRQSCSRTRRPSKYWRTPLPRASNSESVWTPASPCDHRVTCLLAVSSSPSWSRSPAASARASIRSLAEIIHSDWLTNFT